MYLITELDVGGAEKTLCRLASGLDKTRYDIAVACLTGEGPLGRWLTDRGIPVHYIRMKSIFDGGAVRRLAHILETSRADILHTFLFHANIAGPVAARIARTRTVITSVRVVEPRLYRLWTYSWTHRLVDAVTCVSESVRRHMLRHASVPAWKLVTIPNGVSVEEYQRPPADIRRELGIASGAPIVLCVARLEKQKGVRYLLHAARMIIRELPEVRFLIAGKGRLEKKLRRLSTRLNVSDNVSFLGFRSDVPELLSAAEMVVCPSLWEGMPNIILEAMAAGKPVVATAVDGSAELVDDHVTGLLVEPADVSALADAVRTVLADPERARQMGNAGRMKVQREFSLDRMIHRNVLLYERLLSRFGPDAWRGLWSRSLRRSRSLDVIGAPKSPVK